jgi:hypothetical protein
MPPRVSRLATTIAVLINLVTTVQAGHRIPFNVGTKRAASDIRLGILHGGQEIRSYASEREWPRYRHGALRRRPGLVANCYLSRREH